MAEKKFCLTQKQAEGRHSIIVNNKNQYEIYYDVILCLRKEKHDHIKYDNHLGFEGSCKITFTVNKFGETEYNSNLIIDYQGEVYRLKVNGAEAKYQLSEGKIVLEKGLFKEESVNVIEILYYRKYRRDGNGLHWFKDPSDDKEYVYTQFEAYECNQCIPSFDQPNLKATFNLTLLTPEEWVALSNEFHDSELKITQDSNLDDYLKTSAFYEEKDDLYNHLVKTVESSNYKITRFGRTPKVSTYLYALAAGPYFCHTNTVDFRIPLRVFMRDSLKNCGSPKVFMDVTMAGFDFYEKYFETKFQFSKYDQIYVPEYNFGAMENPGLVTYNEVYCWKSTPLFAREARFAITILHELAHMWFGNYITMNWWDDLWLNEAFATFISYLACMLATGIDQRYINATWIGFFNDKKSGYAEDEKSTTHSVCFPINDTDQSQSSFDSIVYNKGSSILKQIYYFVGHENFGKGLANYFGKYGWTNTVFNNFVDCLVDSSNNLKNSNVFDSGNETKTNLDLKSLCSSFLLKIGLTQINSEFTEENGLIKEFKINQKAVLSQHNNLQTLMIDILFIYEDHSQKEFKRVIVEDKDTSYYKSFVGLKAPTAIILNHNDWAYVKWNICDKTFDYVSKNYDKIGQLDRCLILHSIYNKAKHGELSPLKFLDAALIFLEQETESFTLQSIINNISASVHYFIPLNLVGEYANKIFKVFSNKITTYIVQLNKLYLQNDNSNLIEIAKIEELSRLLLTNLLSFSMNDENRNVVLTCLVEKKLNSVEIPSTILQKDIRFMCIKNIFQSKSIPRDTKESLLKAECESDGNSDLSKRYECICNASLPDPENKRKVWDFIANDTNSTYIIYAYMAGFIVYDQLDFLSEYLEDKFFEVALKYAEENNYHKQRYLHAYLTPLYFIQNKKTIDNIDIYLTKSSNNDYQRHLLDLKDDVARLLKAQKACLN